ncbi:MAG: hypothetical protein AAGA65_07435 [Actinomycetota bacterium]
MQEARAYDLVLDGDEAAALRMLWRFRRYEATYAWEQELLERTESIASLIEAGRIDLAADQLTARRRENCESLGLRCL